MLYQVKSNWLGWLVAEIYAHGFGVIRKGLDVLKLLIARAS